MRLDTACATRDAPAVTTTESPSRVVAIVGAGAVGGWLGARLASAGHRVHMVGRPSFVDAVVADGLRFIEGGRELRVRVGASTTFEAVELAELVLITTKSKDTTATAEALAGRLRPDAQVVSLQNGVDNAERAAAVLGRPVWAAAVYVGVEVDRPGVVRHTGRGDLALGAAPLGAAPQVASARLAARARNPEVSRARKGGAPRRFTGGSASGSWSPSRASPRDASPTEPEGESPRGAPAAHADLGAALAAMFTAAGVPTVVVADVVPTLWQKLVVNVAYNAVSAITRRPYGVLLADPELRAWMTALAVEALAVAAANGVALDAVAERAGLWRVGEAMPAQLSSTAQDLLRGRPTEIDALNGYVARLGATLGVDTPENRRITAIVRALEAYVR
jgi:2-dehydropantoate 2-reductase